MENLPNGGAPKSAKPRPRPNNSTLWLLAILGIVILVLWWSSPNQQSEINYGMFYEQLERNNVAKVEVHGAKVYGEFREPPMDPAGRKENADGRLHTKFVVVLPPYPLVDSKLDDLLRSKVHQEYTVVEPNDSTNMLMILYIVMTVALVGGLWFMFRRSATRC